MPGGCRTACQPSTYSVVYVWPWPPGTPVENGRSAVTCQKVTNGIRTMPRSTSFPGGWLIQSGSRRIRRGLHQTIGSEGCIMYRTLLPFQGWPVGGIAVRGSFAKRTVRPSLVGCSALPRAKPALDWHWVRRLAATACRTARG